LCKTFLATRCIDAISPDLASHLFCEPEIYWEVYAGEQSLSNGTNPICGRDQDAYSRVPSD
jgi:hypothetical protein